MGKSDEILMPCTECGTLPVVGSYDAWSGPRFFFACPQCDIGTYGPALSQVDARRIWNANNINVDYSWVLWGDLMSMLYAMRHYEGESAENLVRYVKVLVDLGRTNGEFAEEVCMVIEDCNAHNDWKEFDELYQNLTPMG